MSLPAHRPLSPPPALAFLLIGYFVLSIAFDAKAQTQNPPATAATPAAAAAVTPARRKKIVHKRKSRSPAPASAAAAPLPAATPSPPPAPLKFAAQLAQAGTRTCLGRIEQLGNASLEATQAFGLASNWTVGAADTRPVSVLVGQHYGSAAVPYGATEIIAAPVGAAQCDGFAIQVVPSPMNCIALKQKIVARGKFLADLAGVSLLQDAGGQTLLVPTGADTCVLVGLKHAHDH